MFSATLPTPRHRVCPAALPGIASLCLRRISVPSSPSSRGQLLVPALWASQEPCSRPRRVLLPLRLPWSHHAHPQLPAALLLPAPADPTPAASLHPRTPTTVLPVFFPPASHSLQDMSRFLQWEMKVWIKICSIIPSLKAAFRLKGSKDKFPKERRSFRDRFLRSFSYIKMKLDAPLGFFQQKEVFLKFACNVCLCLLGI